MFNNEIEYEILLWVINVRN